MPKANKTSEEKAYHDLVAQVGCVVCGAPACVHHARFPAGGGQRSGAFLVAALCWEHHQGGTGIHRDKKMFEMRYGSEMELVNETMRRVFQLTRG